MIRRHFPRTVAAWGRLAASVRELWRLHRRAAWRHECEAILTNEHDWPMYLALSHVALMEEVAEDLLAQGKLSRWPTAREAIGKTVIRGVRA